MESLPHYPISRIAIIGAGPSGISAAKHLLAESLFDKIDIFEQQCNVGGVWNLTSNTISKRTRIPQLDPNYDAGNDYVLKLADELNRYDGEMKTVNLLETPMYNLLETNIPKQLMQYGDKSFDKELPLFPRHENVLEYCQDYAEGVRSLIKFGRQVSEVRVIPGNQPEALRRWSVTAIETKTQIQSTHDYDAVVVANGHFSVPFIPPIKGIENWASAYRGSIIHSKAYRDPTLFTDKKVLVVGNSASGVDIGAQIGKVCKQPLLQSSRTENFLFFPGNLSYKEDIPEIVEFMDPKGSNRSVRLANGRIEQDLDAVIFATGYFYSFPFLKIDPPIITNGLRTRDVYQQLFHIQYPTLAFPVLQQRVIPFPMAENQAAVIARVWAGRLALPSEIEMRAWEKRMLENRGDGKAMHVLSFPEDVDHLNMLYDWAASASPRCGLDNEGMGLMGTRCDERKRWMRSQFPAIKKAYAERGENRFSVKTMEELGFDYDKSRETQADSEEELPIELIQSSRGN